MTTTIKDQAALVRGSEDHSTSTNGVHPPAKLTCPRRFTKPNQHPFDDVEWVIRDALIGPADKPVFEQKGVEFPAFWSQNAVNVVADKYFRGKKADKERSVKTMVSRLANWYVKVVKAEGYFGGQVDLDAFAVELQHAILHQRFSFNSPVMFNVGRTGDKPPRVSACFTLSVEDSMAAILNWYVEEGLVFKAGSGAGVNLSTLREAGAPLRDGGCASGPLSFARGADSSAGTIKSAGAARRAAKLLLLNVDHPDIEEFIECKVVEERKARVLAAAGFDMGVGGKDIHSVQYQNANNSVGLYDEFLQACVADADWTLKSVVDGRAVKTMKASALLRKIASAAHSCADPGVFYLGTMNKWHTSPDTGYLDVGNPCCEFLRKDASCNLASLRLTQYYDGSKFNVPDFAHDVSLLITAMDASVMHGEYPVAKIAENVRRYRELGIGFCDLGALLMQMGLPYDSDVGRAWASVLTALLSGLAWCRSGELAEVAGPYPGWKIDCNSQAHRKVMQMHLSALQSVDPLNDEIVPIRNAAIVAWDRAVEFGHRGGYRNAQVSLMAPVGTISFMMDADTTGVEPELALVKFKKLSGGGTMKIINQSVPAALKKLGYTEQEVTNIVAHVLKTGAVAGSPIRREDLPVFDCSLGERSISPMGHLKMTAAIQPFIDGSSSKTVNLPNSATVEDFEQMILEGWKLGVKNLAMYRDGCKVDQPLNVIAKPVEATAASPVPAPSVRRRLPRTRQGATTSFSVAGCEGYLKRGEYPDGQLGEIFLQLTKSGSTLDGFLDSCAIAFSLALQHNVPLETLVSKYVNTRFEPSGPTDDPDFPFATSVMDYVARRLAGDYLPVEVCHRLGILTTKERAADLDAKEDRPVVQPSRLIKTDAPFCDRCGVRMQAAGACYACSSCGATSGCS